MKRKELVNKQVVRAISLGLATIMVCTPMTAFAEENEGSGESNSSSESSSSSSSSESSSSSSSSESGSGSSGESSEASTEKTKAAKDSADSAVQSATTDSNTVKADVVSTVKSGDAVDSDGKDLSDAVKEAADDVDASNFSDADTDLDNADTYVDIAVGKDELAAMEAANAEKEADNANDAVADADDIATDANTKIEEKITELGNADGVLEAKDAYNEIHSIANAAQADFDAKVAEYERAKGAAGDAAAKVAEYEQAYNTALANADANAAAAAEELAAAKAEAEALQAAVEAAKAEVDASAKGALEIKALEEREKNTSKNSEWKAEDELFCAIMAKYYLPEQLGIENAEVSVKREQGYDNDSCNYFTVKYTDNEGNPQTAYYNYKLEGTYKDIVVFEKRDVEVKYAHDKNAVVSREDADRYVDEENKVVSKEKLAEGLADKTYVDVNNTYYEKNDVTASETLVEDSTVTGTSTEDISVDETTKTESYKVTEDGKLVKEVTASVTTITYTGNTFESDKVYATDAERDAAAALKEAELETATGKDATVVETETTTYTATGTYIPTFKTTIEIDDDRVYVEDKEFGNAWNAQEAARAIERVKGRTEDRIEDEIVQGGEYYVMETVYSDMQAEKYTLDPDLFYEKYSVTGTADVTYAKVTKEAINQDAWQELAALFTGKDSLEAVAKKWVEAQGGIYVGANWVDWDSKTADVRYVAAVKVTSEAAATEDAAKKAVEDVIDAVEGAAKVKVTADSKTDYSYKVNYLEKSDEDTENQVIATETYGNAEKLKAQVVQNMNYLNKNIKMKQTDDNYRAFVDGAVKLVGDYERLLEEAQAANASVKVAQDKVSALQDEIDKLQAKGSNLDVDALNAELVKAEAALKVAKDNWESVLDKLGDAEEVYERVMDELTDDGHTSPVVAPKAVEQVATEEITSPDTVPSVVPVMGGADVADVDAAGAAGTGNGGAGAAGAGADDAGDGAGVITIEDEEVPLAAGAMITDAADEEAEAAVVTIEDEEVPLAVLPTEAEKATMSWWWLLVVALLGATGYKMYKEHQKKKELETK